MLFFAKKPVVVVAKPVEKAPELSKDGLARIQKRAESRLEQADTTGALRRLRQTADENRLI